MTAERRSAPLRSRIGAFLFEQGAPADAAPAVAAPGTTAAPLTAGFAACVVGSAGVVVPVAAACAGELRARAGAPTALLCVWQPLEAPPADPPPGDAGARAGATTPAAKRAAARLSAHGLAATACGRLAWLALDTAATGAAVQAQRARTLADVPFVLALAGPATSRSSRCSPRSTSPSPSCPPTPTRRWRRSPRRCSRRPGRCVAPPVSPGPPRWAAMAGLARLRSLPQVAP